MEVQVKGELEIEQKGQSCKGNIQDNTAMQDELLKQLHEQYAVNNNANLGTIVTLVVAVIAVIGYFGYVYVHTGVDFSDDFGCLVKPNGEFYLDALLLIYLASVSVLAILIRLCIYQGVAQRKEQFIIHAIRKKYFGNNYLKDLKIFPKGYHPYGKKNINVLQGLYGELVKIFIGIFGILSICILFKLIANVVMFWWKDWAFPGVLVLIACMAFVAAVCLCTYLYCKKQILSYEDREKEFPKKISAEQEAEMPKICKKCKKLRKKMAELINE